MGVEESTEPAKRDLRRAVMERRTARSEGDRVDDADALCARVLTLSEVAAASTVAAYVSTPAEPGTGPLLEALAARGVGVLLPVLRHDFDLDWAWYEPGRWEPGRFGLVEPAGPRLGVDAVTAADVVLCPGVAGDAAGRRLGRGGGSYDRVLARVRPPALRCLLLYDDEVLPDVPTDPHDVPVDALVTPSRVLRAS